MKYLKTYENTNNQFIIVIFNAGNAMPPRVKLFYNNEDFENYILNYVNQEIIESEDDKEDIFLSVSGYKYVKDDENNIPAFLDPHEAIRWFNNENYENNYTITYQNYEIEDVKLDDRIKYLMNINKYNL